MRLTILAAAALVAAALAPAHAALVRVGTAAGIGITVQASLAGRFEGFIRDIVAAGYRPRRIGCYAPHGHVRHSRHHFGAACDFDQRGWGRTAPFMRRAGDIARAWGLRDGCGFRRSDCGHIDDGG